MYTVVLYDSYCCTTLNASTKSLSISTFKLWEQQQQQKIINPSTLILANKIVIQHCAVQAACGETTVICNCAHKKCFFPRRPIHLAILLFPGRWEMHLAFIVISPSKNCLCKRSSVPCQLWLSAFAGAKWALHGADLLFNKRGIKKKFVVDSHADVALVYLITLAVHKQVLR